MLALSEFYSLPFSQNSQDHYPNTPILSVYVSEIFPTWMRAQGVAFSLLGLFGGTLIYTQAATTAFATIGWKYYLGKLTPL
jgi:hypothetical protein